MTNKIHTLPANIRSNILKLQDDSEITIGWVQLTIVLLWGLMYLVSPKLYPPDAPFSPVPWALTAYFFFTILRLYLSYRRRLGSGMLTLSVIIDIGLLTALLISFSTQYMQPASFVLKIPTGMYIFIFISIRALRFEARYVILAGVCGSLAWLGIVIYAVLQSPPEAGITRNFVDYMTGNRILIGAEIDKLVTIVAVTAILTLAIRRAQRTMIEAVSVKAAATDLSRFVPSEVARRITEQGGGGATAPQTDTATILFIDIENFTAMGEQLAPQVLVESLNEYFALVVKPIEERGGSITQFQGDAILASFNLPNTLPDHAQSAVTAALQIMQSLATHQFNHDMVYRARIGICTGPVIGGLVGVTDRVSYTVHGDAVNLASRLEAMNKKFGTRILIADSTKQLLAENNNLTLVDTVVIRGRQSREPVYTTAGMQAINNS